MTPDFPLWAHSLASQLRELRSVSSTPQQFEQLFKPWIDPRSLASELTGAHSRNRCWSLHRVFWTFLWQVTQTGASCRQAVRHAQALAQAARHRPLPKSTSPFCQARARLPLERLAAIHHNLVEQAQKKVRTRDLWQGHRVLVIDGTCITLPDTHANQKQYPQPSTQAAGCGFPLMRLVALLSLSSGLIISWVQGSRLQAELTLLQSLWGSLRAGDILLGDRGFCCWGLLAQCQKREVHAVFRLNGPRREDFRRGTRISRNERLVQWRRPTQRPKTIPPEEWSLLPKILNLRVVRCPSVKAGFRSQNILLVTTLLDTSRYPARALAQLYLRRWAMELSLRDLKTTLQMDRLSCKSPATVERELRMHLLVHNLVRCLMLEAAVTYQLEIYSLSFAGSLATAKSYSQVMLSQRGQRRRLFEQLLQEIAFDPLPLRPGRREPRAVKQRPKNYDRLTRHRRCFKERSHRSRYRKQPPNLN